MDGRHVTILNATISGATIAVSPGLAGRTRADAPSPFRLTSQISESRPAMGVHLGRVLGSCFGVWMAPSASLSLSPYRGK